MTATPIAIREEFAIAADDTISPLVRIKAIDALRIHLRAFQATLVEDARQDGRTWEEIGDQLGMTRQAAQQRFSWAKIA